MSSRGFTLLEVMVATLIMGIAVVGLLSGISASMRTADRLTDHDRAALLARAKMDELLLDLRLPKLTPIQGPIDPILLAGAQGGWRARLSSFEFPPNPAPGAPLLERLELEVWWMAGEKRRNFTLEAFRAGVVTPQDVAGLAPGPQ